MYSKSCLLKFLKESFEANETINKIILIILLYFIYIQYHEKKIKSRLVNKFNNNINERINEKKNKLIEINIYIVFFVRVDLVK